MDVTAAYSAYAIFRRTQDGLQVEVAGAMLRPWLDAIEPWRRVK